MQKKKKKKENPLSVRLFLTPGEKLDTEAASDFCAGFCSFPDSSDFSEAKAESVIAQVLFF